MFRHKGKSRTYIHNLKLASLLSFVAGIVNVTGVLSLKILTTNVTGHFAYFSEYLVNRNYDVAIQTLFFILAFLIGAFVSNLLIEIVSRQKPQLLYALPMIIEILILTIAGFSNDQPGFLHAHVLLIACSLLFAMGLQNSLVTKVSQSVVRTTHLTGLFTDLGIELSQLFFFRTRTSTHLLQTSIRLKLAIIGCFFAGCVIGGFVFRTLEMRTLLLASACLVVALFYDNLLFRFYKIRRKLQAK